MRRGARHTKRASGRFLLRIEPGLHESLRADAAELGVSLNDYCARKLAAPLGGPGATGAAAALERATALFGSELIGVAAFGSWARAQAAGGSDVDLLVVLEQTVRLTRGLYRRWDETPLAWGARSVEAHFVHLPAPERPVAGLWAEVAVDGIVLFDRGLRLSTRLVQVRHDIVSGRIVRRVAHGQAYWTRVA
jgi:hypothetical protein